MNPPPGSARIVVRMLNLVPDGTDRRMVLELGYQTEVVPASRMSATVNAPADSSYVQILAGGVTEFSTPDRVRFAQQSVYDVFTTGLPNNQDRFDTIVVINANRSLTTLPVAQVRVANMFPDTTVQFEVRLGCPNGKPLTATPLSYRSVSLYQEVNPGTAVFSIQQIQFGETIPIGTFECTLDQYTPYTIIAHRTTGNSNVEFMLLNESDFTNAADRPFLPVNMRDANMRVCNLSGSPVTLSLTRTGQVVASNVEPFVLSAYASVPTCEQEEADVVELRFQDGRTATDSTSLTLRGLYTVIATSSDTKAMIIVPPLPVLFNTAGKAIIRTVHAAPRNRQITISAGARTDASSATSVSSGTTLAADLTYGSISNPTVIEPGALPLTVTTSVLPTALLHASVGTVQPDQAYLLVVGETPDGLPVTYLLAERDQPGTIQQQTDAALFRFVNGSPTSDFVNTTIASVVENGNVFYRNSLTTSVAYGSAVVSAAGATIQAASLQGQRTLLIYTQQGSQEIIVNITSDPLRQIPGQSDRRVINATFDLPLVSVTYDTVYAQHPDSSEVVARDVAFATASPIHVLQRDRRGSMYVYDATQRKLVYTLPIVLGPLGNSYSLIVVGRKESGYEVISLQEF